MTNIINNLDNEAAQLSILKGKKIAVVGYGNQGRSQALNMRDSGLDVVIGNVKDSYAETAESDGFTVLGIEEAVKVSDIIFFLIPDEVQKEVFNNIISPNMKDKSTLVLASGYNYFYGFLEPSETVDVLMIAPRMIGWGIRDLYEKNRGFPVLASVGKDASGSAKDTMISLCDALGVFKKGGSIVESSFREETLLDLLTEQSWAGAMLFMYRAYFDVVTEFGCSPEAAILEMYASGELAEIAEAMRNMGLFKQLKTHSHTSQYGQLTRGPSYVGENVKELLRKNAKNILDGTFAREWSNEQQNGMVVLKRNKELATEHPMEKAERSLYLLLGRGDGEE